MRYLAQPSNLMNLQFFTTDKPVLELSNDQLSRLVGESMDTFVVPTAAMVAFSVIRNAANDPSTLLEKEVSSIDKLNSGGVPLRKLANSQTVNHLPQSLLEDAMMDFAQLTPTDFTVMALNFQFSDKHDKHDVSNYESADSMLHEFNEFHAANTTFNTKDSIDLKEKDFLEQYHWNVLVELKGFVSNALKSKLNVFRKNAV